MKVDSRLLRQSVVGVSAIVLMESLFVAGCVNGPHFHKTHFWNKGDVTAAEIPDADSEKDQKAPKVAPSNVAPPKAKQATKVAASAKSDPVADLPGRVEIADFRPEGPGRRVQLSAGATYPQNTSQLAPANPSANGDVFAPYVQKRQPVGSVDNRRHDAEIVRTDPVVSKDLDKELNPFTDEAPASPSAVPAPQQAKSVSNALVAPVNPFGDTMDRQMAAARKSAELPAPPSSPRTATDLASVRPAAPRPAINRSPNISLVAAEQSAVQPSRAPVVAMPKTPATDAFSDRDSAKPVPAASNTAFEDDPRSGATTAEESHASNDAADAFSVDAPAASPPPRPAPAGKSPQTNLASHQQQAADLDAWQSAPQSPKPTPANVAPAVTARETSTIAAKRVADAAPNLSAPVSAPIDTASESGEPIICDSNTVRGRFIGESSPSSNAARRLTAGKSRTSSNSEHFSVSSNGAASVANVPAPNDELSTQSPTADKRSRNNVINAVGRRIGNQPVDESLDARNGNGHARTVSAEIPQPFCPDDIDAPPAEKSVVDPIVAPEPPAEETRMNSEAWFAIGLALGLASTVIMWLRLRHKSEDDEEVATTEHRKAA